MSMYVTESNNPIDKETRSLISKRYHTITKAINRSLWDSASDEDHSFYVGSYGRGTAINTSDLDVLVEVPNNFYVPNSYTSYNPQSRLLQVVKEAILESYPHSEVKGDGQVVVINFSDGMRFEVLPAICQRDYLGRVTYKYPDTHMGGNWLSTNPKLEQEAIKQKDRTSNGLLCDTCKHMRYVRDNFFSSYHLSGIVIDSFVYTAIGNWRCLKDGEMGFNPSGEYEEMLLNYYNDASWGGKIAFELFASGSGAEVNTSTSLSCLGKVLNKMV